MPRPSVSRLFKVRPKIDAPSQGLWLGPGNPTGDGVWLGSSIEVVDGKQPAVWLTTSKEQVVAVAGKRGSGKSFTLGVLIEGLIGGKETAIGRQTSPRAVLVFDPLDVYWTTRFPVFDTENPEASGHYRLARDQGLPELEYHVENWIPGEQYRRPSDPSWFRTLELSVSSLQPDEWEILLDVSVMSDPMGQALMDVIHLVQRGGLILEGAEQPRTEDYGFEQLSAALGAAEVVDNYHEETRRALRQRLRALGQTGLFTRSGTEIQDLLSPGSASVISLGRLPHSYRSAVVAVLTRMLVEERSKSAFCEKRLALDPDVTDEEKLELRSIVDAGVPRTTLFLDEAQAFLAPGPRTAALDLFVRFVKEGRNLGLSAVLATQQPSAIEKKILSQVETFITHQLVTESDIRAVRENLKASFPEEVQSGGRSIDVASLLRMLQPGSCMISAAEMNTAVRRSTIVQIRPRATVHGGIEL